MELSETIRKQEAQSKLSLADEERVTVTAFFKEREKEKTVFDSVNLPKNETDTMPHTATRYTLRDDIALTATDRSYLLSQSPDTDGTFVRVPRTL